MEGWYVAYIGPPRDVVHRYGLTVGKMVDLYVETPGMCLPEPILRYSRPNLCFSMYICTKQTKRKKKSSLVNPRTEKAIGVDLRVPPSRVSPNTDYRSVGNTGKVACVPNIYIEVRWKVGMWHMYVHCVTLFTDMG